MFKNNDKIDVHDLHESYQLAEHSDYKYWDQNMPESLAKWKSKT